MTWTIAAPTISKKNLPKNCPQFLTMKPWPNGRKSRNTFWFQNVTANPKIFIQVGNKRSLASAERISPEGGSQELVDYSHRHPMAFRELVRFMGYRMEVRKTIFAPWAGLSPCSFSNPYRRQYEY